MKKKLKKISKKINMYHIAFFVIIVVLGSLFFTYSDIEVKNIGKGYCEISCSEISASNSLDLDEVVDLGGGCNCRFSDGRTASFGKPN